MVDISKAFEKTGENLSPEPHEKKTGGEIEFKIEDKLDDHLYMYHMPYTYIAEQIRKIRTFIYHSPLWSDKKVFMVTSSLPSEGKSLISSNLAISIARGEDKNVILIECDLRRPSLYKLFGNRPAAGVADILQGRKTLDECLVKTPVERLEMLHATKEPPSNPSELLESRNMRHLFEEIKERFPQSYLIVDTPPVQATVDPKVISKYVDGIVFVVKYRYVRQMDYKASISAMPREKIVGTVLNAVDAMPATMYKYKKYNYHKYY
ncbi:MAG TPA: CpsD/CapB family tyrosine-protein kinase [Desulfomonilia bacterium]|jgi:protein-tyrosine kinase